MHAEMNIFYTLLIQNIENGKLHRQVDSVEAGLNRDSQLVPRFFLSDDTIVDDTVESAIS